MSETLSKRDAMIALQVLAEWSPPDGVMVTVHCVRFHDQPGRRGVKVGLSAVKGRVCLVTIRTVPDLSDLDILTESARLLLQAAWDEPACIGIGPEPDEGGSAFRPVIDTTRFGRDG